MTWIDRLALFSYFDAAALIFLLGAWIWISWRIETPHPDKPSVSLLMNKYRSDWMVQMVTRQPRMFDAQVVNLMRQGTAFFASATMLAIGGGLALVGNPAPLQGIASDLTLSIAPEIVWEIKLILIITFLASAFLKFVWSHRLFGYCAIMMAAVPNEPEDPMAYPRAEQAAEVSITAARSFNKAMRATYFSLASTAWLLGALPLMIATAATLAMLYRREFTSQSREILLQSPPGTQT
ncbi:DUF599 domain-containing protein [Falsiphaeobacter marinintestinus]|uniref:DUF599 domain-containing protein n=1 Tax=Falsiphaeobacter marinintestinus TaxID=1492905 RepID=UPI0011B6912C|nr:DUF599 domain-containing protein [Phaeobacter marinintestinus]